MSSRSFLASLLLAAFPLQQSLAAAGSTLPSGGSFTAGSGSIGSSANVLTIQQTTNRGIINWSNFSIGAGNAVFFRNGNGATLNRVTGAQMSLILGSLQSTGTVYLINPQGVLIGPGGRVNTGGDFVASTLNLPDNAFLAGGALLFSGSSQAFVKNLGMVSSSGGSIFLIADQVSNNGSLAAANGSVGLGAGEQVLLKDSKNDQRIFVNAGSGDVTNAGAISAAQVELKANGGNVLALGGNNGGQIRATGTATRDGHVWLVSNGGTTSVNGSIRAQNANGLGGTIETSGHTVEIGPASIHTGPGGNWLVDPVDLSIDSTAATTIEGALNGGANVTESTSATGSSGYGVVNSSGHGDIDVNSSISWNSSTSLTLSAYRNIDIATGVSIGNAGSGRLTLAADNAATGTGTVSFSGTGSVSMTGSGNVDLLYHPSGYPTATSYSGKVTVGSGAFTPYMTVDTGTDLQNINNNLNGNYALNANLDLTTFGNFTPIGYPGSAHFLDTNYGFQGIFDGRYHTISNLTINESTNLGAGLFAQIGANGIVRNVGLVDASLTVGSQGSVIGILAGENGGAISNSYSTGAVQVNDSNGTTAAGGLVGQNDGSISNCYSSASITDSNASVQGNTLGGLVAVNDTTVTSSLATGVITVHASNQYGEFVGTNGGAISTSYFDSTVGATGDGLFTGSQDGLTGLSTSTLKNGTLPSGLSSTYWKAFSGYYPLLFWQTGPVTVTGTVYSGSSPVGAGATVIGLANGASFGSAATNSSGAYTLTAPPGTTGVLDYLSAGASGNTFSNALNGSAISGVDIYEGSLRLINATTNSYASMIGQLSSALGSNSGSNYLFTVSGGGLNLRDSVNFALVSSAATTIDQSIHGTGTVLIDSAGALTLNASNSISASGSGTEITLVSGGAFTNNGGSSALSVSASGRWLVYSQIPGNDTVDSLSFGFKQYNATYNSTTVAQSTGNGLLYTDAPVLTPSLTSTASKTYDGLTTASLSAANFSATGGISGDTLTFSATGASYADANAGSSKSVTATGITVSAADGAAPVYGYQLSSTTASANIGTINQAMLTYNATTASRAYGSANPTFGGTVTGFVNNDTQSSATTGTLSFASNATTSSNVGSYYIDGSGLSATNYGFQQANGNATALTINAAPLYYTATAASKTYGSANPTFTGSVTGFVNNDTQNSATTGTLAFSSNALTSSGAGSYYINGSGLTPNGNYTLNQASANATAFTINPASLYYTANTGYSSTYGSAIPTFSGSVTGLVNNDSLSSVTSGSAVFSTTATSASNAGTYAVNGSGLTLTGNNYTLNQASGNSTAFTINPALLSYTATAASRTYGSANPTFTGTVTGFVNNDTQSSATTGTLTFGSNATTASSVGSYDINGSGLTPNGNYTLQQASGNATALTINAAPLYYTATAASKTYGSANPTFTGSVTGFVNNDTQNSATTGTLAFSSNALTSSGAGSYYINGSGLTPNGNYTLNQASANATAFTINPASLYYTANTGYSSTYGSAIPTFSGSVTGLVNNDSLSSVTSGSAVFSTTATSASNAGTYAVNGSGLTLTGNNYTLNQASGNSTAFTINPALLSYTATAVSRTYGSANPTFSGSVTGFVNGDTLSSATTGSLLFSTTATAATNVGSYAINGSGLTPNGNYTLQQASGNATALTINAALLSYTATAVSKTYGGANPTFSGSVTGLVNDDTLNSVTSGTLAFGTSATQASNAGSYAINGSGLTLTSNNYTLGQASGNATAFTINPALLTYTASSAGRTYGSANPAFSGSVTGFVNGDTLASATTGSLLFSSPATAASNVGLYAINGSGLSAANYTFQQADANSSALTISAAPLSYTATPVSRAYGSANPTFAGSLTGLVNGDTMAAVTSGSLLFSSTATAATNVGSYAINGSGLTLNSNNYTLGQAAANTTALTINPVTLTYTATAGARLYGSANPTFSGSVTGFVNEDTLSSATTGSMLFSSSANAASTVGSYAINGSGLTANNGNYVFEQAAGNATALTINPAALTASVLASNKVYNGTATASGRIGPLSGILNGDSVTVNTANASYIFSGGKTVGNGKTVTESGATLAGAEAQDYTLTVNPGTANITPAPLTAPLTAGNKVYDTTTTAVGQIGALAGIFGNDSVTLNTSEAVYNFANKNAGTNKTVTASGAFLTGTDAGDYTLTVLPALANITPATVTASILASNKVYNGTTAASGSLSALTGVLGNDAVTLNAAGASYAFLTAGAGTDKTVTESGATLAGAAAGNYVLAVQNGVANIAPEPVTVTIGAAVRPSGVPNPPFTATYSGPAPPGVSIPALLASLSFHTSASASSAPGTYPVTGTSNYPNVALTIVPGTLEVTFSDTPQTDPALVTSNATTATTPTAVQTNVVVNALMASSLLAPNSLLPFQISTGSDWPAFSTAPGLGPAPLASASSFKADSAGKVYPGGVRRW